MSDHPTGAYMGDGSLSINMKVQNPSEFKLTLDYEHYNFEFKQLLEIMIQNEFREVEAKINTLHRASTPTNDGEAMMAWQTGAVKQATIDVPPKSDTSFGGDPTGAADPNNQKIQIKLKKDKRRKKLEMIYRVSKKKLVPVSTVEDDEQEQEQEVWTMQELKITCKRINFVMEVE